MNPGMSWRNLRPILIWIAALGLPAFALAGEDSDWRLEFLKGEGLSTETSSLEKLEKGFVISTEVLTAAVSRLGAEDFATRAQAQREILLMGEKVLPMLQQLPQSNEPEVRQRLTVIRGTLEAGGRWTKETLMRQAVTSLLHERLKQGESSPEESVFAEFFQQAAPSLEDGYRRFRFSADQGMTGSVVDGVLHLNGNHANEGDQRLLLDAKKLTGKEAFPDTFRIEVKLGGAPGGEGQYHIGVSIGNVRALFHPGYPSGGFRFQRVDSQEKLTDNTPLGFDPERGKLQRMSITAKRITAGKVELEVVISQGDKTFTERKIVAESVIGKLDHISLDRSGRAGGDGLFDDLVVELGKH